MATNDRSSRFAASFEAAALRAGTERDAILPQLQRQLQEEGLAQGGLLLDFFQALPAAVLAAERAEYERIVKRHGKDDPRAHALEESLDALERAEAQAARGRARALRAMEAARMPGAAFHGFVSDAAGEPLPGMTVRVARGRGKELAGRTAQDGYFRVALPETGAKEKEPREGEADTAEVTIVDGQGNAVHEDPLPLPLRGGGYREYIVASGREADSAGDKARAAEATPRPGKGKKHG